MQQPNDAKKMSNGGKTNVTQSKDSYHSIAIIWPSDLGILSKIQPEPPQASVAPKGLEPKPEPLPLKRYEPPRAGRRRR